MRTAIPSLAFSSPWAFILRSVAPYAPPKSKPLFLSLSLFLLEYTVVSRRIVSMLKNTSRNLNSESFSTEL